MKLKLYDTNGSLVEEKEFDIPVFEDNRGLVALNEVLVALAANMRQGNACAKTKDEVSGTGKKPWRQKGTGMARHGSKRSPIWVGGGVAHGPRPRNYRKKINNKVKNLALKRAVFECANAGIIHVVVGFEAETPKTKQFNSFVEKIIPGRKSSILMVDNTFQDKVALSARNIPTISMVEAETVNCADLIDHANIIITEAGLSSVLTRATK